MRAIAGVLAQPIVQLFNRLMQGDPNPLTLVKTRSAALAYNLTDTSSRFPSCKVINQIVTARAF